MSSRRESRQHRRQRRAERARLLAREAYMKFPGNPEKAKAYARERANRDPILVGFWETILISIGIKVFLWAIEKLIDYWHSRQVATPAYSYQVDEPGYTELGYDD